MGTCNKDIGKHEIQKNISKWQPRFKVIKKITLWFEHQVIVLCGSFPSNTSQNLLFITDGANLPLMFAPESGNMLGGTIVNITGPCFQPDDRITCRFDTESVVGAVVDTNRAICVQPRFWHNGYARFEIAINNEPYKWKGKFFVGKQNCKSYLKVNHQQEFDEHRF